MTSEKSYDNAQRIDLLVPRVGTLEGHDVLTMGAWQDTSSMTNGWSKTTGYFKYVHFTLGALNFIYFSAKLLAPGTDTDGTQIVTTALASFWRPVTAQRFPIWSDAQRTGTAGLESAGFELQADGTIHCFGIAAGSTRCDVNAFVPLDL
jgi:hypothetical protein